MGMRKLSDRIYEFFDLDLVDEFDQEELSIENEVSETEVSMSSEEFFNIMSSLLDELSVEEAESIGLF